MSIDPTKYTAHQSPGKFQGSHPAAEYFWEQMLNGDGESIHFDCDGDHMAEVFLVSVEECEAFGFQLGTWITLWSDSQGFCWITQDDSREAAEQRYRKWAGAGG